MPEPSNITSSVAPIDSASLRYEQNGKSQLPVFTDPKFPTPIDFNSVDWEFVNIVAPGLQELEKNQLKPDSLQIGLATFIGTYELKGGASYRVNILVEQDIDIADNTLDVYPIYSTDPTFKESFTLALGMNKLSFIFHKNDTLALADRLLLKLGSTTSATNVNCSFEKIEIVPSPTTRILTTATGDDTFDASLEGANVWKILPIQQGGAGRYPQLTDVVATNIEAADCTKLKLKDLPIGTPIMGDFTRIEVYQGIFLIYFKLPQN